MSLFKYLLILPFLALTACGFTPVYGTDGSANVLLNSVLVQEPKTRDHYLLTRQLEKRLGRAADPRFDLGVSVSTSLKALGINSIGNINRYNLSGHRTIHPTRHTNRTNRRFWQSEQLYQFFSSR